MVKVVDMTGGGDEKEDARILIQALIDIRIGLVVCMPILVGIHTDKEKGHKHISKLYQVVLHYNQGTANVIPPSFAGMIKYLLILNTLVMFHQFLSNG